MKERTPQFTDGLTTSDFPVLRSSTGLMVIATVVSGSLNYAYTLVLTHLLPTREYSAFSSSMAILIVVGTVANAAVPWVLAQELRRSGSENDGRHSFSAGLAVNVVFGLIAAGVCALFGGSFLGKSSVAALAAGAFGFFVASTGMGWALGRGRYRVLAVMVAGEVGVKVVIGVLLVNQGAGVFGAIIAAALGSIAVIIATGVVLGADRRLVRPGRQFGRILRSGAGLSMLQGLLVAAAVLDAVLVEIILPAGPKVAAYQLAATLGRTPIFLAMTITMLVYPTIVGGPIDRKEDGVRVFGGLGLLLVMVLPAWAVLATIPRSVILSVAPPTYAQALHFLPVTAASGVLWSVVLFVSCSLGASGRSRLSVINLVGCIALGGIAMAISGRAFGVWGFAIIELLTASAALAGVTILGVLEWGTRRLGIVAKKLPWALLVVPLALLRSEPIIWLLATSLIGVLCLVVCFPTVRPNLSLR